MKGEKSHKTFIFCQNIPSSGLKTYNTAVEILQKLTYESTMSNGVSHYAQPLPNHFRRFSAFLYYPSFPVSAQIQQFIRPLSVKITKDRNGFVRANYRHNIPLLTSIEPPNRLPKLSVSWKIHKRPSHTRICAGLWKSSTNTIKLRSH